MKAARPQPYGPRFRVFWGAFPKRNGKKARKPQAWAQWKSLGLEADEADQVRAEVMDRLECQVQRALKLKAAGEFYEAFPDADRWLKDRRWEDEL